MSQQQEVTDLKLLIGIPSRGEFKKDTSLGLTFLVHALNEHPLVKIDGQVRRILWSIAVVSSSSIQGNRQKLVDAAIANEVDWLLFIDDDMSFPAELVHAWMTENRPVIAANCPTRSWPCNPTARDRSADPRGAPVYSDLVNGRWGRVWRVGTGIMLLRSDVLKTLPRPAFTPRWDEATDDYVGEDWVLCEHIEAAGFPILVDHKLSQEIGHIGDMKFTHDMIKASRTVAVRSGIIVPRPIGHNLEDAHATQP